MPLNQRLIHLGEDPNDWESESENECVEPATVPPLLSVAASLAKPNDTLCDTCIGLELTPNRFIVLPGDRDAGRDTIHHGDNDTIQLGFVKDVKERSGSCPFCRLVLRALANGDVPEVDDGEVVSISLAWHIDGPPINMDEDWIKHPQIRLLCPYARKQSGGIVDVFNLNMNLFPEITLLANDAPTPSKSYFSRLVGDQIDFSVVRNWLAMCHIGHGDFCNQSKMVDHEISDPAAEIPFFRLIDVVDNCIVMAPRHAKYVALSYVWGNINISKILRLLKVNVQDLEKPGSLLHQEYYDKIPITVRDAILAVRELHIRYLWIDSLCIIQDDDGEHGSKFDAISKMDLVYGAAYLTIIAATGADSNAGLPGVRQGTRGVAQPVEEIAPDFRLVFKTRAEDYIRSSVYYTRGWTFQEQLFAKRKLTFIGGQVEYSCRRVEGGWREDQFFEDRYTEHHGVIPKRDVKHNDIREFESLIASYSGLSLKFHSDIYNAFAGMARYFKLDFQINLCHGIPDKYFDWFILWTAQKLQTRRDDAPSWSWSGWDGECHSSIWDWYEHNLTNVRRAQRKRTWIIWYQRNAHDSAECTRIWTPKADPTSSRGPRNFYGGHVQDRFPFNCTQTVPTPRTLTGAPTYIKDAYHPSPGSGFLQFWTVSAMFKLADPTNRQGQMPTNRYSHLGIFGKKDREVGTIFIHPDWCKENVPKVHEFILICEGRDKKAEGGLRPDDEPGWRYMVMLIEWHGDWAERIAVGWIKKQHLKRALKNGPVWKEIVLG
ncbi:HET-domain-containing protein [Pholiota conissans]|uniref:HET-domain-containing protein n=1 Tax=Pholiota conissans TaxID=109636 RepID=A0A9P5Z6Y9_9AGAR|nr:HET-domain-containing protein [Pholiota conissans]